MNSLLKLLPEKNEKALEKIQRKNGARSLIAVWGFIALALIVAILQLINLEETRSIALLDIDEAGYLSFARSHMLAFVDGGPTGYIQRGLLSV